MNTQSGRAGDTGLDPRRARMVRECGGFGIEWRILFEAGRLVAALAIGALLALGMVEHNDSTARSAPADQRAAGPEGRTIASPEEGTQPEVLAPRQ